MQHYEIITGTIEKVLFQKKDTDFAILLITREKSLDSFVAVGNIRNPVKEIALTLQGQWTTHSKYGDRFEIESFEYRTPVTLTDMAQWLRTIKGIGTPMASKIVRQFGEETMNVIENQIHLLLCIQGIGAQHINLIREALAERKSKKLTFIS